MSGRRETRPETVAKAAAARSKQDGSPWLTRPDWAAGRVVADRRRGLVVPWLVTLLAIVLFVPSIWFVWRQIAAGQESLDFRFFVLIAFALIVFGFFGRKAFVHTRQAVRFQPAVLHLEAVPIPIGRDLRGTIAAPIELRPDERLRLELSCVVHVSGSGESGGHEKTVWQDTHEIAAGSTWHSAEGIVVPVQLPVATHPPETTSSRTSSVRWTLTAMVLPSRRWLEAFDLPVFRTAESPPIEEPEARSFREAFQLVKKELAAGRSHRRFGPRAGGEQN